MTAEARVRTSQAAEARSGSCALQRLHATKHRPQQRAQRHEPGLHLAVVGGSALAVQGSHAAEAQAAGRSVVCAAEGAVAETLASILASVHAAAAAPGAPSLQVSTASDWLGRDSVWPCLTPLCSPAQHVSCPAAAGTSCTLVWAAEQQQGQGRGRSRVSCLCCSRLTS